MKYQARTMKMFNFDLVDILREMQSEEMKIVKLFAKESKVDCSYVMAKMWEVKYPNDQGNLKYTKHRLD